MTPESDLTPLDPKHPIDASHEPEPFFRRLVADSWSRYDPAMVAEQVRRAAWQAGVQSVIAANGGERRYVVEETSPWQLPDDWYRAPYPELAEAELAHEWDTHPGTLVAAVED